MKKFLLFLMFALFCIPWAANAQTLFSEGFEDGSMPTGWTTDGSGTWSVGTGDYSASTGAGLGTYNALITHSASGNVTKLITPEIDLSSVPSATLSFMHVQRSWAGDIDELRVYYRTSTSEAWTLLVEYTSAVSSWTIEEDIVLPNTTATYQLAFEHTDNYGYGVGLDEVTIAAPAACPKPQNLTYSVSGNEITLSWTSDATQWNVEVNGVATSTSMNPYTFTGDLATEYTVRVQADCGLNEVSEWTNPVSFTTDLCMAEELCELTYELADSYGDGWNGNYINVVDVETEVVLATWTLNSGSSGSGSISVCDGRVIRFDYVVGGTYTYPGENSWTVTDINGDVVFAGNEPSDNMTGNFTVNCTPATCPKPQNLTYSVSGNAVTLSWESDATAWNVEVNGVATATTSNPYTFTGELATEYTVRVQADCGHNDVSEWTNAVSFTTDACMPEEQIIVNYMLNDSYGDGWNGNAILVVDENCNIVEQLTIESGASASGTVKVCGSYVQFLWYKGNYPTETSWSFTDNAGNVLFEGAGSADMATLDVLYTIDNNPYSVPTDVAVSEVGPHSAKLSWTQNGDATAWQINLFVGDEEEGTIIDANSNPFVLTGLDSETAYYAQVRATGANGTSVWTCLGVSFTTDVDCPAPTELAVNPFTTSADVTWNGSAESYNIRYRTSESTGSTEGSFFEDFENGTLGDWTAIRGNEGNNSTDWRVINSETAFSSGAIPAHSGSYVAMSRSWASEGYQVSNWLISPQVTLDHALSYWVMDDGAYHEHYDVYVSTTTPDTSAFTLLYEPGDASADWTQHTVDLSSYNGQQGYIAFRLQDYDQDYLFIDDVLVGEMVTVPAGEWVTVATNEPTVTISGLNPETEYELQVQSNCGTDGESEVATTTFTTASACDAPNTMPTEVDGTTATLSWEGYQESFNLNYRKQVVDPTAPATIIITVPDVWGDGSGYQMLLDADANTYGTIIPETGGLTESGDASEETYAEFEYKIPTNADGSLTTENILINQTVTIEIPAGTYDWCITNPTPEDRVWIASSLGNVSGRQDDFVFEPGVTYEFTVGIHGTNDGVDLTVTRPMGDWVVVENVTSPYNLTGLDPETYYEWQVEGINTNCTGDMTSEIANFTTGIRCGIVFDENNKWDEDFENMTTSTKLFTGVTPQCWTVAHEYTSPSINHIGLEADTLPQLYHSFNTTENGHYSLRIKYRSLLAMPELDESIDLSRVRMSLNVRQPQTYYKLQIGVMSDLDDESTFVPVATVNNASTTMEEFVCDFSSYTGGGRYIAFKNVGGSTSDPYCSNYLDDIVLTYVEEAGCAIAAPFPYKQDFEGFTTSGGASGVEPDCWEVISEDVALDASTKPQVYRGFNTTTDGHYSLRMKNRCVYAMPEFAEDVDVKELTLSFSLRQAKSFYRLEVGVVDAAGNFVVVEEINNPSTSMEDVTVDFSTLEGEGTGKRIAFHNILRNSANYDYSYNYIDDINLYYTSEGAEGDKNMEFAGSDEMNADHYLDNIAVYPNPTTGMLHIDAVDVQKVECYSQMGQLVGVYDNVNELNISELANGVYMLRITVPQGVTMRKVVKR